MKAIINEMILKRKSLKLTQQDLADKINVSRSCIASIETERSIPTVQIAKLISEVLDLDWTNFFGEGAFISTQKSIEEMKKYPKIENLFEFDERYKNILGLNQYCQVLKNIKWIGTEKIDGINIRIYWNGYRIQIAARTEQSQIPIHLMDYLSNIFLVEEMEYVFEQMFGEKEVYLFGEGYGYKIQANSEKYFKDEKSVGFILFDVNIDGFDLPRNNVSELAERLGLESVPIVFEGTLDEAIDFVRTHPMSTLGNHLHEMEGIVLQPVIQLYDKNKNPLKFKCKYRDLVKTNYLSKE